MRSAILAGACVAFMTLAGAAQADPADDRGKPAVDPGKGNSFGDFFGAGTTTKVISGEDGPNIDEALKEAYDGPKARIAVSHFTDKTGTDAYDGKLGAGLADQLATALFNSNRFIVLEREYYDDVLVEQDRAAEGRVRKDTAAPIGEIEGAELLVTGAVTELEGETAKTESKTETVLGKALQGVLDAITKDAHMAIDIRVIDVRTSRIVASTSVEGSARDVMFSADLTDSSSDPASRGTISIWRNTPIEKAIRVCIQRAVDFIVSKTPAVYYRYGSPAYKLSATPRPPVPAYDIDSVIRVKSSEVNMRGGPGTNHDKLAKLPQGTPLLVKEQSGDWVQVRTGDGQIGWLAGWLVYPDATTSKKLFKAKAVTTPTSANLTQGEEVPAESEASPESATSTTTPREAIFDPAIPTPAPSESALESTAEPAPEPAAPQAAAAATAPAAESGGDAKTLLKERLRRLKELFDEGLITQEDYDAKRHEFLEQF